MTEKILNYLTLDYSEASTYRDVLIPKKKKTENKKYVIYYHEQKIK